MKTALLVAFLVSATLVCRANHREFVLGGIKYVTSFEVAGNGVEELQKKSSWQLGDSEPPIGPNKAYTLALAAFKEQFGSQVSADARFVVLRILGVQNFNFPYWEIVLVEKPTEEEIQKRRTGDGRVNIANIAYFVFMNGEIIKPKKAKL